MKKSICSILVLLVMLSCLTACSFTTNMSGAFADAAESTPKVEEMMTALAENSVSDAKELMHPNVAKKSDDAIDQMIDYLDGRETDSVKLTSINVNTSTGTSGKTRQEEVVYQITLDDGDVIYLNVVYLIDNDGTGFTSFQLVLGVV